MQYVVEVTNVFEKWLKGLKDRATRARVLARIDHIRLGHFGDHKPLGGELFELRFFFGPGYRVYYTVRDSCVVFLLCGGEKDRQDKDIDKARKLLAELED